MVFIIPELEANAAKHKAAVPSIKFFCENNKKVNTYRPVVVDKQ